MKKNINAFSLVELLVVVTIVVLLAATAVPAYRDYTTRAQISSAFSTVDAIKTQIYQYYSVHGLFPDAAHLGLNSPQAQLTNPATINPLLTDFYVISTDYHNEGYTCTGDFGEIWMFYDKNKVGVSDNGFDFGVYVYYGIVNGEFITTAEDTSPSGVDYVKSLVNPTYPDYNSLFTASGCTFG